MLRPINSRASSKVTNSDGPRPASPPPARAQAPPHLTQGLSVSTRLATSAASLPMPTPLFRVFREGHIGIGAAVLVAVEVKRLVRPDRDVSTAHVLKRIGEGLGRGGTGIAVDSSWRRFSPVFAEGFSLSSSSRGRTAKRAFHACKAFPAAFLVRPSSKRRQTCLNESLKQAGLDVRRIGKPGRSLSTA